MNLHLNNKAIHRDDRKSRETVNKKKKKGGETNKHQHCMNQRSLILNLQVREYKYEKEKSPQKMIVLLIALTPIIIGLNLHARFTVGFVLDVLQFAENVKVE